LGAVLVMRVVMLTSAPPALLGLSKVQIGAGQRTTAQAQIILHHTLGGGTVRFT
jgi:hypothetical protein